MTLHEFEDLFFKQSCVDTQKYDEQYFEGDWREKPMSYSLDDRREIEGKNPINIIETLKPCDAVDIGCGPGALISLLAEKGFESCLGVDISQEAKNMAEDSVKQKIHIAPAWATSFEDKKFDLVVCREVLEHLTVRQIFRTVREMCRISKDKVYVTTRFHPNPKSVYDVTTEFDVDPTHISCMNIEMLRLFFVLNGFKRDCDLEQKMDWLDKKRVLVYRMCFDD